MNTKITKPHSYTSLFFAALGLVLSLSAEAGNPWVSVPSTPNVDNNVHISGGNLTPGSVITVEIKYPDGADVLLQENVDQKGIFQFDYAPGIAGGYSVNIFDSNNNKLGSGKFGYFPD